MKTAVIILFIAFSSIECRKVVPINKNANIDFINMETGGQGLRPAITPAPVPPAPAKPITSVQQPTQPKPSTPVTTAKPVQAPVPMTQPPKPSQPQQPKPTQMDLKPVQPGKPAGSTSTTPGPGNVKALITFYDSQGKASVIRPYSYSDAVKKGRV